MHKRRACLKSQKYTISSGPAVTGTVIQTAACSILFVGGFTGYKRYKGHTGHMGDMGHKMS